jgi:hypothetical protein
MLRVTDRYRERVGGIGAGRRARGQKHAHHDSDLPLVGVAVPDDRLLHEVRRVFFHMEPGQRGNGKRQATRLTQFQGGLRVSIDEGLFDGRFLGRMIHNYAGQPLMELSKAIADRLGPVRRDATAGDKRQPRTLSLDYAPAGVAQTGVESENTNRGGAHADRFGGKTGEGPAVERTGVEPPREIQSGGLGRGCGLAFVQRVHHGVENKQRRSVTRLVIAHGLQNRRVRPFAFRWRPVFLQHLAHALAQSA